MKIYKSERTIKRFLKHYRGLIETHPDPAVKRIAQGMEDAIRYCFENTHGWNMEALPSELAGLLYRDLNPKP